MKYNFRYLLKSIISFLILIFGIYYIYINFINETRTLSFNNKNLSSNFEINIYNNIKNIKNYLNNYEFIQSYIIKKKIQKY